MRRFTINKPDANASPQLEDVLKRHRQAARHFDFLLAAAIAEERVTPEVGQVLRRRFDELQVAALAAIGGLAVHSTEVLLAKLAAEEAAGRLNPEAVSVELTREN
jgi:hypothetical protein